MQSNWVMDAEWMDECTETRNCGKECDGVHVSTVQRNGARVWGTEWKWSASTALERDARALFGAIR